MVLPDTFTSLGGNQFVDSPILGNWSTWLSSDLKDSIIQRYSCNGKFGLIGKSSGGYGALYNALVKPGQWDGVVSHSGDVGFETMFMPTFAETVTHISRYGSPAEYVSHILSAPKMSSDDFHTLMICSMAASYDPGEVSKSNPLGINLPIDMDLCEIDKIHWAKWLEYDTLRIIESKSNNLDSLNLLFIDCGNQDQYGIQYGSRKLSFRLSQLGIEHVWQEFDGTHSGIDYRLDVSLPMLSKSLID
jgi:S-formylglutathione hydrolase FrmB